MASAIDQQFTDQAYVVISDLARIRAMRVLLGEIIADDDPGVLTDDEYETINQLLRQWERKANEWLGQHDGHVENSPDGTIIVLRDEGSESDE